MVILAVAAVVTLYLWQEVSTFFLVTFAGILFGVLFDALAEALRRRTPLPRTWALGTVLLLLLLASGAAAWLIGPRIVDQMSELGTLIPDAVQQIRDSLETTASGRFVLQQLPSDGGSSIGLSQVQGIFSTAFGAVGYVFVAFFVAVYAAYDPGLYRRGVLHLVPRRSRERGRQVLDSLGRALRHWLAGRFASMAVVGLLTAAGLFIIGVPLALSLGLIAAILSFVPYIGPIASVIPAALVGLLESPMTAVYVLVVYVVVQFCESYLITPLIQKRAVSLPPALLIIAQVLSGMLFGVIGIILATPLTVTVIVLVQMLYVEDTLGDDEVEILGT